MNLWPGLAAVGGLIFLSALMAAAETALVRVGRVRALALREEKARGSEKLVVITSEPARYLNAILLLTLVFQLVG
ncbi:MAG: CNNM domain-containing protein, partial [Planctomycetota bacterium]